MQVDVHAYTSTDVYACTSADAWGLVRVTDASWCICMHKYNAYACTSAAVWSGWCRLMYMHTQALLYEHWRVRLMQVNVYAYKHTAVWALARVVDASWCIRMHKCGCLSASESDWCKLMYMHAQVQCIRMHKCCCLEWLMQADVYAHTSTAVWALASTVDASQCICIQTYGCLSSSKSGWCKLMYTHAQVRMLEC